MAYNETPTERYTMFQTIEGKLLFIVDLLTKPSSLLPIHDGGNRVLRPYADALQEAILMGLVTKPGKYGIEMQSPLGGALWWQVYAINE